MSLAFATMLLVLALPGLVKAGFAADKCGKIDRTVSVNLQAATATSKDLESEIVFFECNAAKTEITECRPFNDDKKAKKIILAAEGTDTFRKTIGEEIWAFELACFKDKAPTLTKGKVVAMTEYAPSPFSAKTCPTAKSNAKFEVEIKGSPKQQKITVTVYCNSWKQIERCYPPKESWSEPNKAGYRSSFVTAEESMEPKAHVFTGSPDIGGVRFKLACGKWTQPSAEIEK